MSRLYDWITRGTRAAQPAASASNKGMLYFVTDEHVLERSSGSAWESELPSGSIVQRVTQLFSAGASGTNAIPMDDSIPQITEGDEYMSLAFTPRKATNNLRIDIVGVWWPNNSPWWITAALFQDPTANALAAMVGFLNGANALVFSHEMVAGVTSAITFKVRAGRHSAAGASIYFNGDGARRMGGVMASRMTITEFLP